MTSGSYQSFGRSPQLCETSEHPWLCPSRRGHRHPSRPGCPRHQSEVPGHPLPFRTPQESCHALRFPQAPPKAAATQQAAGRRTVMQLLGRRCGWLGAGCLHAHHTTKLKRWMKTVHGSVRHTQNNKKIHTTQYVTLRDSGCMHTCARRPLSNRPC